MVWLPYNMLYCQYIASISWYGLNNPDTFVVVFSSAEKCLQKDLINFLYQRAVVQRLFQKFGNFLYWSGNFCHFPATFDDFPESHEYSMYSKFAVDPAVSCKRNRSSLMNFPIIQDFPNREHLITWESL